MNQQGFTLSTKRHVLAWLCDMSRPHSSIKQVISFDKEAEVELIVKTRLIPNVSHLCSTYNLCRY